MAPYKHCGYVVRGWVSVMLDFMKDTVNATWWPVWDTQ